MWSKNITKWMKKEILIFEFEQVESTRPQAYIRSICNTHMSTFSFFPMPRNIWSIEYGIPIHTYTYSVQLDAFCHIHCHHRHRRHRCCYCCCRRRFGFILPFQLSVHIFFWVFGRINKTYKPSCACVTNIVYLEPSRHQPPSFYPFNPSHPLPLSSSTTIHVLYTLLLIFCALCAVHIR